VVSFDKPPGVIISVEKCNQLLAREPLFPLGQDLVRTHHEHQSWKTFKEQLVSNQVFRHKLNHHLRGPGGSPLFSGRDEVDITGLHPSFRQEPLLPTIVQVTFPSKLKHARYGPKGFKKCV
jgi:hypothetical protein